MFYIKKCIAICLCIAMVMCSTLPSLASENDALQETTESKIVEQLKEDLGEEKANEILNDYEETRNEDVGDVILSTHDEEPEENEGASKENVGASTASPEEETDEDMSSEPEEDEKSTEEISEQDEDKTNVDESYDGNLDKNIATSSELNDECEVIELEVEKENSKDSLLGASEPWMWWYLTDGGQTIHYTSVESVEGGIGITVNRYQSINYDGLTKSNIIKAVFDDEIEFVTCNKLFNDFVNLERIENIAYVNTTNVSSMDNMFNNCKNLETINVSGFDTRNVTSMSGMFSCGNLINEHDSNLLEINGLQNFNTENVTDMYNMFGCCDMLESINLTSFNTSKVTDMRMMFQGCSSLTNLNLSNFDTSLVTNMREMFYDCSSLTNLNVSNFDTSSVTNMSYMFSACDSLTNINVSNFDTSLVTDMSYMFAWSESITNLALGSFNTSSVSDMQRMFTGCKLLTNLNVTSFDTSSVTNMTNMFSECESLTNLDLSSFNTSLVTNMSRMFQNCKKLEAIDLSSFNTNNVINMEYMFYFCGELQNILVSNNFLVSSVNNSLSMFYYCVSLVGGNGTTYDSNHTDKEYARIDGGPSSATPGYFTLAGGGAPILSSITVNTPPTKVKYKVGETFEPAGLKINLNYSDSSTDTVTYNSTTSANFTFNPSLTTALTASNTYVTITYSGKTCNQDVEVIAPQSITVKTAPSKVKYAIGETFNPTGLKINLIYSDTTTIEEVSYAGNETNFSFNPSGALNTAGASIPITITYTKNGDNFDCIQNVEVVELSGIAITTHATKLNYNAGETFDPTGLVITLTFSDGTTEQVFYNATTSSSFTFSPTGPLTRTGNVITVTYAGKTTTETLNVKELTGITIATNPTKLSYATGQSLNPNGLVLTLTFTDSNNVNTTENVTYNSTTQSKFAFNPSGTAITTGNVTVTYDGKTGAGMQPTFAITVRTVASISVINRPSKTSYSSGNKLSPAGLSIKVNYTDGTNETIAYSSSNSGDFSFNPSTSTSLNTGYANVTVTYGGKSTTFAISVTKKGGGYVPSSGSGNNGGGGGGGGIPAGTNPQNNAPATTQVASSKSISGVANSSTSTWTSDPATGKWKLNVTLGDGQVAPATNGFFMLTNTVTEVVNNVPIQTQINNTYYFDAQGNMVTGWVQTADNKWFFFDNAKTVDEGKMSIGWKQVQGSWYYFTPDGSMMENGITPDGFSIGADGKWVG